MSPKPEKPSMKERVKDFFHISRSSSSSIEPTPAGAIHTLAAPAIEVARSLTPSDSVSASLRVQDGSHGYPVYTQAHNSASTGDDKGGGRLHDKKWSTASQSSSATYGPSNWPGSASLRRPLSPPDLPDDSGKGTTRKRDIAIEVLKESLRTVARIGDAFPPLKTTAAGIVEVFERIDAVKEVQKEAGALKEQVKKLEAMFNPAALPSRLEGRLEGLSRALEEHRKALEQEFPVDRSRFKCIVLSTKDKKFLAQIVQDIKFAIEVTMLEMTLKSNTNISQLLDYAILNKLGQVVGAEFNREDREGCTPGTRVSLLANLLSWATANDSAHVFWLNGMAGTGKTTVAETFCSLLAQKSLLGASFFCSMKSKTPRHDIHAIFPCLAKTMAERHPAFHRKLVDILARSSDPLGMSLEDQYTTFILHPSEAVFAKDEIVVVTIDALDECEDQKATEKLLTIILTLQPNVPLRFFVTSRPERRIRDAFESQHHQLLCLHNIEGHMVQADICLYLTQQLWRIKGLQRHYADNWPPQEITAIVQRAGKLFIYASTIAQYIDDGDDPCRRLQEVSAFTSHPVEVVIGNMEKLYDFILQAAFSQRNHKEISHITSCLSILISAKQPLSVSTYANILTTTPNHIRVAFASLHSVVRVPEADANSDEIMVFHASFADYISSRADIHIAHAINAKQCISIMELKLCLGVSGVITSYQSNEDQPQPHTIPPYLGYACTAWGKLILSSNPSCQFIAEDMCLHIENFLCSKFLYWLEVLSAMGDVAQVSPLLHQLFQRIPEGKPLKVILSDFRNFTTSFLHPIQYSAPHIYLSALPFAPQESMISKLYLPKFPSICVVHHSMNDGGTKDLILQFEGHTDTVGCVSFSPDGGYIASGSDDHTIQLWSVETGQKVLKPFAGHTSGVWSVGFSPDGEYIASGSHDNTVRLWSVKTGQEVPTPFLGHTSSVSSVSFSPNGKYIASGSRDHTIRLWSVETGQEVSNPFEGHNGSVYSISFSPDGKHIASGSCDNTIRVWSVEMGQEVTKPFAGHKDFVLSVSFSPDGRYIASGSRDKTIRLWSVATGQEVATPFLGHTRWVRSVSFSPDGRYIVSASRDHTIRLWSVETGQEVSKPFEGHTQSVYSVSFSPDGRYIASGSRDKTIQLWTVEIGQEVSSPFVGHRGQVWSVSFSPDGKYIASGSDDNAIRLWSVETGQEISKPFMGHVCSVSSVSFSPSGRVIASGSLDHTIRLWSLDTGQGVSKPFEGHTHWVLSVLFSPDGRYIASGSRDKTIRLWNVETGQESSEPFEGHTNSVRSVVFSPSGRYIASGSDDGTIRIWSVESGQGVSQVFEGHENSVFSVSFSPNGRYIVSGDGDGTIRVWSVETGQEASKPFVGHTGWVCSVSFSPDGRYIASGSSDHTIRLWNAELGQEVSKPFIGHRDLVSVVLFSPGGKYIVSGSGYNTVRLWSVEKGQRISKPFQQQVDYPQIHFGNAPPQNNFLHQYPTGSVLPNKQHWLTYPSGELMLWVPPSLWAGLYLPGTVRIFGNNQTKIDFSHFVSGDKWQRCVE